MFKIICLLSKTGPIIPPGLRKAAPPTAQEKQAAQASLKGTKSKAATAPTKRMQGARDWAEEDDFVSVYCIFCLFTILEKFLEIALE